MLNIPATAASTGRFRLEGDAVGWSYRKDWFEDPKEKEAFKAKYGYDLAVPKTFKEMRDIAEFFNRPDQNRYGIAIYTRTSTTAWRWALKTRCSPMAATSAITAPTRSTASSTRTRRSRRLENYRKLYGFTPPGWANAFFVENNQAITENLAAMSMNYFAFFPSLINEAIEPECQEHRLLRQSGRSGRRSVRRARRSGHLGRLLFQEQGRGDEIPEVVHQGRHPEEVGRALGGYTCNKAVLESAEFQNATPYNKAFYETMFKVKDFWAVPEYARTAAAAQPACLSVHRGGEGTAKETLDALAADWNATFKKYGRGQ